MKKLTKAAAATAALASFTMLLSSGGQFATASAATNSTLTIGQGTAYTDEFIPLMDASLYTSNIYSSAFDSLMNLDNHLNYIPWLATKYSWSKDHKTLTMYLRKNAVWSDGKPITSDDVLFFMDYLASKAYNTTLQGEYESLVDPVVGAQEIVSGKKTSFAQTGGFKKINNKEFQINFSQADAAVLWSDVAGYYPLPKHVLAKTPIKDWATSKFDQVPTVTDGAYVFTKVNGTDNVEMTANTKYWAGVPKIKNIVWRTVTADVAPGLLANNSVQLQLNGLKPQDIDKLKQIPNVSVVALPSMSFGYLGLQETNKEFKDYRVRQAVEYALNRQAMVKGILSGYGKVITSPVPDVSWAAASKKDGLNPYNYSPAKAKSLLDAAGWKVGKGGWRIDPVTGKTADLHLTYSSGSPSVQAEAVAIQQYLGKVGVKVSLDSPVDFGTEVKKVEGNQVQMWLMGWSLGSDPDPRGIWNSTDPMNFERWVDKKNDALIAQTYGAKAFNKAYRKQAFVKWQVYVNQQMPLNFLWQSDNVYAYSKNLSIPQKDWAPTGPINMQDWTLQ